MQTITVKEGQNIFDIALQYLGDVSGVQHLLDQNELSYTNLLFAGQQLVYDPAQINTQQRRQLVQYFSAQNIVVASDTSPQLVETPGPVFVSEPFAYAISDVQATISLKANKRSTLYWAFFAGTVMPSASDIQAGTGAISFGSAILDAIQSYTQILGSLTAETAYTYAAYIVDFNEVPQTAGPEYESFSTIAEGGGSGSEPGIFTPEFDQTFE